MYIQKRYFIECLLGIMLLCSAACSSKKSAPAPNNDATVFISVYDDNNNPIPNASINLLGYTVNTSSNGQYILTLKESELTNSSGPIAVHASGYADVYRSAIITSGSNSLIFQLRAWGINTRITLDTPSTFTLTQQGTTATLQIAANSLVTPNGDIATGSADIVVTYWSPTNIQDSMPGPLFDSSMNVLQTFGMWGVEVTQNGVVLQPKAGQTVDLEINFGEDRSWTSSMIEQQPNIYTLNEQTSLWQLDPSKMQIDTTNNSITVSMQHLSYWNIDSDNPAPSIYFYGYVYNKQGQPIGGENISLQLYMYLDVAVFTATTDANGAYCIETNYIFNHGAANATDYYIPYYIEDLNHTTYYLFNEQYPGQSVETTVFSQGSISTNPRCDPLNGITNLTSFCNMRTYTSEAMANAACSDNGTNTLAYGFDFAVNQSSAAAHNEFCENTSNGTNATYLTPGSCTASNVGASRGTCLGNPFANITGANVLHASVNGANYSCMNKICTTPNVPFAKITYKTSGQKCPAMNNLVYDFTGNANGALLNPIIIDRLPCNNNAGGSICSNPGYQTPPDLCLEWTTKNRCPLAQCNHNAECKNGLGICCNNICCPDSSTTCCTDASGKNGVCTMGACATPPPSCIQQLCQPVNTSQACCVGNDCGGICCNGYCNQIGDTNVCCKADGDTCSNGNIVCPGTNCANATAVSILGQPCITSSDCCGVPGFYCGDQVCLPIK